MTTAFGKFCRLLRVRHDEVLRDMAQKLGVSSSYLSAVENGKRSIPQDWKNKLTLLYSLTDGESEALDSAIHQSLQEIKITLDLNKFSDSDRDTLMAFARRYDSLGEKTKISLQDLFGGIETHDKSKCFWRNRNA